jgi:hypothetical protein
VYLAESPWPEDALYPRHPVRLVFDYGPRRMSDLLATSPTPDRLFGWPCAHREFNELTCVTAVYTASIDDAARAARDAQRALRYAVFSYWIVATRSDGSRQLTRE